MSELDDALVAMREDRNDPKRQSKFYDLFLNASFFVPTLDGEDAAGECGAAAEDGQVLPLIMESEGKDYLMIFDARERLNNWTQKEAPFVEVPGHVLAATSMPPLHWALNVGTEFSKEFFPDEIAWLKEVVQQCDAAAAKES